VEKMLTKIVPIGNSKGIRLPNFVLKEMNIGSQIEIIMNEDKDEIILKPVKKPRTGWDDAFKSMSNSDAQLVISNSVDLNDWEW
jgi:antitoxin MazE